MTAGKRPYSAASVLAGVVAVALFVLSQVLRPRVNVALIIVLDVAIATALLACVQLAMRARAQR